MNKAEIYRNIAEAFNALAEIEGAPKTSVETPSNVKPITSARSAKVETPNVKEEEPAVEGGLTRESLDEMTYNNLKKFAKESGVDPTGNREAITERLLAMTVSTPSEDEPEDDPEEGNDIQSQVEKAVAEMDDSEIAEILKSVGVSSTGKRQALIAKVVKAVQDGKIDLSGDEDSNEDPEEEGYEDYFPEDQMTDSRKEAIKELSNELKADYKKKKLTDKEIEKFNKEFYLEHEEYDSSLPKNEKLDLYIGAQQRMVDDEGETQEMKSPYEMNGVPACCGHYLKELEESGNLFCETCGQEYEQE